MIVRRRSVDQELRVHLPQCDYRWAFHLQKPSLILLVEESGLECASDAARLQQCATGYRESPWALPRWSVLRCCPFGSLGMESLVKGGRSCIKIWNRATRTDASSLHKHCYCNVLNSTYSECCILVWIRKLWILSDKRGTKNNKEIYFHLYNIHSFCSSCTFHYLQRPSQRQCSTFYCTFLYLQRTPFPELPSRQGEQWVHMNPIMSIITAGRIPLLAFSISARWLMVASIHILTIVRQSSRSARTQLSLTMPTCRNSTTANSWSI